MSIGRLSHLSNHPPSVRSLGSLRCTIQTADCKSIWSLVLSALFECYLHQVLYFLLFLLFCSLRSPNHHNLTNLNLQSRMYTFFGHQSKLHLPEYNGATSSGLPPSGYKTRWSSPQYQEAAFDVCVFSTPTICSPMSPTYCLNHAFGIPTILSHGTESSIRICKMAQVRRQVSHSGLPGPPTCRSSSQYHPQPCAFQCKVYKGHNSKLINMNCFSTVLKTVTDMYHAWSTHPIQWFHIPPPLSVKLQVARNMGKYGRSFLLNDLWWTNPRVICCQKESWGLHQAQPCWLALIMLEWKGTNVYRENANEFTPLLALEIINMWGFLGIIHTWTVPHNLDFYAEPTIPFFTCDWLDRS